MHVPEPQRPPTSSPCGPPARSISPCAYSYTRWPPPQAAARYSRGSPAARRAVRIVFDMRWPSWLGNAFAAGRPNSARVRAPGSASCRRLPSTCRGCISSRGTPPTPPIRRLRGLQLPPQVFGRHGRSESPQALYRWRQAARWGWILMGGVRPVVLGIGRHRGRGRRSAAGPQSDGNPRSGSRRPGVRGRRKTHPSAGRPWYLGSAAGAGPVSSSSFGTGPICSDVVPTRQASVWATVLSDDTVFR